MPKFQTFRRFLGLLLAVTILPASICAQTLPKTVERPEVRVGDRWKIERKDAKTKLVIQTDETAIGAVSATKLDVTINGAPGVMTPDLTLLDGPRLAYDNGYQFLRFPLEIGKKWEFKTTWHNKGNGNKGRTEMEVAVKSQEKVRVAAGEFEALRIEGVGYMNFSTGGSRRVQVTYWYAPAAKAIVRFEWVDRSDDFITELAELALVP